MDGWTDGKEKGGGGFFLGTALSCTNNIHTLNQEVHWAEHIKRRNIYTQGNTKIHFVKNVVRASTVSGE